MHFNANSSGACDLQAGIKDGMQTQTPVISSTGVIHFSYHPGLVFLRMLVTMLCFSPISFRMWVLMV